jgi:hypothetical protein
LATRDVIAGFAIRWFIRELAVEKSNSHFPLAKWRTSVKGKVAKDLSFAKGLRQWRRSC